MKTSRPESSSTCRVKLSVGAAACGIALTAEIASRSPGSPGRPDVSGPPRSAVSASTSGGRDAVLRRSACSNRLGHLASPERCRRRSKKVGTARSIASPPEIPSQLTLIAPTSP